MLTYDTFVPWGDTWILNWIEMGAWKWNEEGGHLYQTKMLHTPSH